MWYLKKLKTAAFRVAACFYILRPADLKNLNFRGTNNRSMEEIAMVVIGIYCCREKRIWKNNNFKNIS